MTTRPALLFTVLGVLCWALASQINQQQLRVRVLAARVQKDQENQRLQKLRSYWLQILASSPTYRDGLVQLAAISYRLGQTAEAQKWLAQALSVDPNYNLPPTLIFLRSLPLQK